jgi:uncharacterized protein (TIGR03435 family)
LKKLRIAAVLLIALAIASVIAIRGAGRSVQQADFDLLAGPVRIRLNDVSTVLISETAPARQAAMPAQGNIADKPTFEFASVKPNPSDSEQLQGMLRVGPGGRFTATNIPLDLVIQVAYQLKPHQMIARSEWELLLSQRFDIEAKAEGIDLTYEQTYPRLQALLADRFKLMVHRETRPLPVYVLALVKAGTLGRQLRPHSDEIECFDGAAPPSDSGTTMTPFCGDFRAGTAPSGDVREVGNGITMDRLAWYLSQEVDRPVINRTGLSGLFDQEFEFQPHNVPQILAAAQEQLGFKLDPQTAPVDVLVIDHVEQPFQN